MEVFLDLLKYTVPAIVVFVAAFFIMKKFMDNEYRKMVFELKKENLSNITPIRLQAYERATLFLERISMDNMIKRVTQPKMDAGQLHLALIHSIRNEYEHNLSQQIYMSNAAWEAIKKAKEETLKVIHMSMAKIGNKGSAMDLTTAIFGSLDELGKSPSEQAIAILKKEVKGIF